MEQLDNIAGRLEQAVEATSALAAESRIKFDALIEMQSEERLKMQEMFLQEKQDLLAHYERTGKRKDKIIIGLIIALVILIGSIVGGTIYVLTNFDLAVVATQNENVGDYNNINIHDGIHLDTTE